MGGQHDNRTFHIIAAHQAASLAPVHVGQFHIQQHRIKMFRLSLVDPILRVRALDCQKFLVKLELLRQGLAQRIIIINQ